MKEADDIGNMVELSGPILGESFFNKEVGQALQLLDGMYLIIYPAWNLADAQTRDPKQGDSAVS